jgi:SAM-dependent MidA family methyltransferase
MSGSVNSVSDTLRQSVCAQIERAGGWLPFDAYMQAALYTPGLGYYTNGLPKLGSMPNDMLLDEPFDHALDFAHSSPITGFGDSLFEPEHTSAQPLGKPPSRRPAAASSDFVTAPELSPLFGRSLARQVAQLLAATGTRTIIEFGAGSGQLAHDMLLYLEHQSEYPCAPIRYFIVEISSELRERQRAKLADFSDRVQWLSSLPASLEGVIVGNEVLDAMPVKLLSRVNGQWHERGIAHVAGELMFKDKPTALRPSFEVAGGHDYQTEIHPQADGFIRTLASSLKRGAALFIDYGFPESEYYHPQRHMGTLMTHFQHRAGFDPLERIGLQDITAHVNFTATALAAQDTGCEVLGYTSQGRFLINCGLLDLAEIATPQERAHALKLVTEHEMGELFKVMAFAPPGTYERIANASGAATGLDSALIGFTEGDRTYTL